jgi:hypothetical protein
MELFKHCLALQCWECHGMTRGRPCEHCDCGNPEGNRKQLESECLEMKQTIRRMADPSQVLILKCNRDEDFGTFVPMPGVEQNVSDYPASLPLPVPWRIISLLLQEKSIGQLELGLDGTRAHFYGLVQ